MKPIPYLILVKKKKKKIRSPPTLHIIAEVGDLERADDYAKLVLLFEQCGVKPVEHYVTEINYEQMLKDIPLEDVVYLGFVPGDIGRVPGKKFITNRWIESRFARLIGPSSEFLEICCFKSSMYERFAKNKVPFPDYVVIEQMHQLQQPDIQLKLQSFGFPIFVKLDNGNNSEGVI